MPYNFSTTDVFSILQDLDARAAALEAGNPNPQPVFFAQQPTVSPLTGTAGATTFTASPGLLSNGTTPTRAWLLGGTVLSTSLTFAPASGQDGSIVYQEYGPGGLLSDPITVTVAAATANPTLSALSLSGALQSGVASSGTINGATSGSTITSNVPGLTVNSGARTYTFNGSTASTTANGLVETLAGATNSPRNSSVTVAAAQVTAPYTILLVGSSTNDRLFTEGTGTANSNVTASTDGTTFTPVGTTGTGATTLGNALNTSLSRPIRFLKKATTGSRLSGWDANGSTDRASAVAAATAAGGVDAVITAMGFNDARIDKSVTSQAAHLARLRSFVSKLRTEIGNPNLPVFVSTTQKLLDGDATSNQQIVWVRNAEVQLLSDPNVYLYSHTLDLGTSDGIHQNSAAYALSSARGAVAMSSVVLGQTVKRGPAITAITAISDTQADVVLTHSFGNDFTPTSAITGFELSLDDFATIITPTAAVRTGASTIRLTFPSTGASAVAAKARYQMTANPVVTGAILSNSAPPFPAEYSIAPINFTTVAAAGTPTLNELTVSPSSATTGTSYTGTVTGLTSGSSRALTGDGSTGLSISGATISGTPTSAGAVNIVETLAGATGSPRTSSGVITVAAQAVGAFNDTFDGTGNLSAHTSNSGHTWTQPSGTHILDSGAVIGTAVGNALSSWVPATAIYQVLAEFSRLSTGNGNTLVRFRVVDDTNYWFAGYGKNNASDYWIVGYTINGTATTILGSTIANPVIGQIYALRVDVGVGGKISLYVDGTLAVETDDNQAALAAKGSVGLRQSIGAASTTAGGRFLSMTAQAIP